MKLFIAACFLFLGLTSLNAQEKKVYIDKFKITDQVIRGMIDEKYAITLYLKFESYFDDGMSHTVSGWYYYDHVKKKIPLVGIWSGKFILYQFADKERTDSILNFTSSVSSMWEVMDDLGNRSGYLEKFEFDYEEYAYKGTWKNEKKELKVAFNYGDIELTDRNEFLVLQFSNQNKKHIALKQFGPYYYGYSIFADKIDASGCKVLLEYEVNSRANPNGMCGAGEEIGYLLLIFDSKGTLLDYRTEDIESCLGNFYSEMTTVPNTNGKKLICKVTYEDEKVRTVTVDGVNFTLTSK
ncbi:hypothetical protein D3C87_36950 [compost metagenome]